jgi:TRAP-type C4-dicarboxylate transport system permease small subunit
VVQAVSIVVLTAMVVINAVNITTRAVFHNDLEWTQEVSLMGAMVIYFFAFGLISKANADIRIEFMVRMLPRGWQHALGVMARLAVLGFQCTIVWLAIDTMMFVRIFRTPVLEISEAVFFLPVIAGAADIALTELIHLTQQMRGELPPPGAGAMH